MKHTHLAICLLLALAAACSGTTEPPNGDSDASGDGDGPTDWKALHVCQSTDPRDPLSIESLQIVGDELTVLVSHGGGCAEHVYGICYSELDASSATVEILHDNGGDTCEAYLTSDPQHFDLSLLREDAQRNDPSSEGLTLLIQGTNYAYPFGDAPTWEAVNEEINHLNTCDAVTDCRGIAAEGCSTDYVNKDADTTALEADIAYLNASGDPIACIDLCRCGALTCTAGKCTASASDCLDLGADEQEICL